MLRRTLLISLLPLLLLAACAEDGATRGGDPDPNLQPFAVQVGTWDADEDIFQQVADGDTVDIVVGFQGLIFVDLALMTEDPVPSRIQATCTVTFTDTNESFTFQDNYLFFENEGAWRLARSFRVPFDDGVASLEGRTIEIELELTDDEEWASTDTLEVEIRDLDGCTHFPDGTYECD